MGAETGGNEGESNVSSVIADSKRAQKSESWLWCRTPTHEGGAEPNISATAKGNKLQEKCFVTAKKFSPKTFMHRQIL